MYEGRRLANNKKNRLRKIRRKNGVRRDILNGITNYEELARRNGVAYGTIGTYIREIAAEMEIEDQDTFEMMVSLQERRLLTVFSTAHRSFLRSQQNAEQLTTVSKRFRCARCGGLGKTLKTSDNGRKQKVTCPRCKGTGKVRVDTVTKVIKGQSGDASFLRVQVDCVREINRIRGLLAKEKREGSKHLHIHQQAKTDLSKVPDDVLIKALETIDQLAMIRSKPDELPAMIESAIEVEFAPVKEDKQATIMKEEAEPD